MARQEYQINLIFNLKAYKAFAGVHWQLVGRGLEPRARLLGLQLCPGLGHNFGPRLSADRGCFPGRVKNQRK